MDNVDETVLQQFIDRQFKLLEVEYQEELAESDRLKDTSNTSQLEIHGLAIRNLHVDSCSVVHGKCVVEFKREQRQRKVQFQQQISSGDVVYALTTVDMQRTLVGTGVVMCINDTLVTVSFGPDLISKFEESGNYIIIKTASFITYKRMKRALKNMISLQHKPAFIFVQLLFGNASLGEVPINPKLLDSEGKMKYVNDKLHSVQKKAVDYALKQKNFAIIHGPPGTGKTTTLVEIILQLTKLDNKILLCAPSNIAVDNILEKLLKFKVKVVRLGHPARMLNSIKYYSLDAAVTSGSSAQVLRDVKQELKNCERQLEKARNDKHRYHIHGELKQLRKELQSRKDRAQKEVLLGANVVLTTLVTGSNDGPLRDVPEGHFDSVVIDECSQALEAACWIVLSRANKVILAGDHLQLPPTIKSKTATEGGLGQSLMERAVHKFGEKGYRLLTHQFRMHNNIMSWVSQEMYNGKLEADSSVASHLLRDLPGVEETDETSTALLLVNTAGCDVDELEPDDAGSRANEGEANIVYMLVKRLVKAGVSESSLSVITPYALQVACIKSKLCDHPAVEIRTVDGFQGREKEAVLLSLVRSNARGDLGFVSDRQRLNVAVSRARRFLCVVADSNTVCRDKTISSLLEHMEQRGVVHSAHEYLEEISSSEEIPRFVVKHQEPVKKQTATVVHKNDKNNKKVKQKNSKPDALNANEAEQKQMKDDINYWKSEIETRLSQSDNSEIEFPSSLTSFERRMVHEAAESLNLQHESVGEEENRHIVVRNISVQKQKKVKLNISGEDMYNTDQMDLKPKQHSFAALSVEDTVSKSKSESSHESKHKISKPKKRQTAHSNSNDLEVDSLNHDINPLESLKFPPSGNPKGSHKSKKKSEPQDFDSLVESFAKLNNTCSNNDCNSSVKLMSQTCELCKNVFCFKHALPEVHGCGEAAHRVARHAFQHPQPNQLDARKKQAASLKLKKQLSDMAESRKPRKRGK